MSDNEKEHLINLAEAENNKQMQKNNLEMRRKLQEIDDADKNGDKTFESGEDDENAEKAKNDGDSEEDEDGKKQDQHHNDEHDVEVGGVNERTNTTNQKEQKKKKYDQKSQKGTKPYRGNRAGKNRRYRLNPYQQGFQNLAEAIVRMANVSAEATAAKLAKERRR